MTITIKRVDSVEQLATLTVAAGVTALGFEEFIAHAPEAHWVALDRGGVMTGRCSLWWQTAPPCPGEQPGVIGHFAALDGETAAPLLVHACRELHSHGCTLAIGPMDGSTWRRYRFVTGRGEEPPFFLEPDNPDQYPLHFQAAGFAPLARYFSNLDPDLGWRVPERLRDRLARQGVVLRRLDPEDFSAELEKIYRLSLASFRGNFLYSPISRDDFMQMYLKLRPLVQPELVLFAERQGETVGFVFVLDDLLRTGQGHPRHTMIIKSLAVLPRWSGTGVGPLLMSRVTAAARELGYRRGIHALMHEENLSRSLSGHHGNVMREYTLYSRRLT